MKAKIKGTGQVLNVEGIYLENGFNYDIDDVELIFKGSFSKLPIDWEERRFELVKAAMQGLLSTCSPGLLDKNFLAALSIDYADTVLSEYMKECYE